MQAVIDRFEGDIAVLLLGEDEQEELNVAQDFLPSEAKEGDYLKLKFELDKDTTKKREDKVRDLLDELK